MNGNLGANLRPAQVEAARKGDALSFRLVPMVEAGLQAPEPNTRRLNLQRHIRN